MVSLVIKFIPGIINEIHCYSQLNTHTSFVHRYKADLILPSATVAWLWGWCLFGSLNSPGHTGCTGADGEGGEGEVT